MINHARTLLLNTPPQNSQLQDDGYEYIPETFNALNLPSTLRTVHEILFGKNPDQYFLNVRGRELLSYIHQTELVDYIYKLDPRITYWPNNSVSFFDNAKATVQITQFEGAPRRLNFGGTFSASATRGNSTRQYIVKLSSAAATTISVKELNALAPANTTFLTDPTNPPTIPLQETQLQFSVSAVGNLTFYSILTELTEIIVTEEYDPDITPNAALLIEPGVFEADSGTTPLPFTLKSSSPPDEQIIAQWLITVRANPKPAITTLLPILEILGEPLFLDLFGVAPKEPYATFKNLWFDHPLAAYRLSGLVLAFIYRAEEFRKANNG